MSNVPAIVESIGLPVNFNVDVVNGIAYLSGVARTKKEMNLVLAYTKETRYVNQLVNYIQHYGLERKKENGRYERFTDLHSWNSRHISANWSTFNLGLHAEHHQSAHANSNIRKNV